MKKPMEKKDSARVFMLSLSIMLLVTGIGGFIASLEPVKEWALSAGLASQGAGVVLVLPSETTIGLDAGRTTLFALVMAALICLSIWAASIMNHKRIQHTN